MQKPMAWLYRTKIIQKNIGIPTELGQEADGVGSRSSRHSESTPLSVTVDCAFNFFRGRKKENVRDPIDNSAAQPQDQGVSNTPLEERERVPEDIE